MQSQSDHWLQWLAKLRLRAAVNGSGLLIDQQVEAQALALAVAA